MRAKVACGFFIVIFLIMLLLPLVFVNLHDGIASEQENRMLATRPPIYSLFTQPTDFTRQFDEWFSDNVGFREQFISLYKKLDILGTQGHTGQYYTLIGQQGHRFFADTGGGMISKFQGKASLSDEQLEILSSGLNNIKTYLDKKDIPLIVMFCVDKETIYPEYYPKSIIRGPVQLDRISKYVDTNTNVDFFNIKEALLSAKESYHVFNKANGDLSHYNDVGAFFAYQELMKHISVYMPYMEPLTIDDINISNYERIPEVALVEDIKYHRLEATFFDEVNLDYPSDGLAFENDDKSLPTILVMRDSYFGSGNYISRYISQHFGKTILIHHREMKHFEEYIDYFNPDIVVFESAERELRPFVNAIIVSQQFK